MKSYKLKMSMCVNREHYLEQLVQLLKEEKEELFQLVKIAGGFLEDSEKKYEEHAPFCNSNNGWSSEGKYCTCGASDWMMKRKKIISFINESIVNESSYET